MTTVIPCLGISQLWTFVSFNVFKIVLLESLPTPTSTHTSLLSGRLHWLPIDHRSISKSALLVYKFLHSGYPKYFASSLKPRHSVYNINAKPKTQADAMFLEVPCFASSVYKSTKHFGLRFAPSIWNELLDDVHSATSLHSFRKKPKT